MADDKKIIFSMVGVSKAFQANKQVLKDIYLSFFYGALCDKFYFLRRHHPAVSGPDSVLLRGKP